jgi:hypothetical protein
MTFAFRPPTIDLLSQAIERIRPDLSRSIPVRQRARNFWAGVLCARDLGASDVVAEDFRQLAIDCGLLAELRRETVEHLIRWGMLARDPFGDAA